VGDGYGDGWVTPSEVRLCPICGAALRGRQSYDKPRCRTAAYRLRLPQRTTLERAVKSYQRELLEAGDLVAHTIYECQDCMTRYLGTQRCPECNRFCTKLGYGGRCPDSGELHLFEELEGAEPE
jgi:hypothetical protein